MVVMQTIIDSFSRCLGSQHQEAASSARNPDTRSRPRPGSPSAASLPLGASRERLSYDLNESQSDQEELANEFAANRGACCEIPPDYSESASASLDPDREHANILAHARKKATVSSSRRHHSDSAKSHRSSLEKARLKTNKRKLDIFRKEPEKPSSLTSFLGSNSGIPRMLCFANPILDSADDDSRPKLHRGNDFTTMDEETITSTLYFDAKYEHIPQNREPIPLLPEFSVPHSDSNDDIIQIYNTGSHKTIQAIYCGLPPPPPNTNTSMMDDRSSSSESTEDVISFSEEQFLEEHVDSKYHASCMPMPMPSPPSCKGKNELDIIQELLKTDDIPPGLRLMSNSSNSTNAAITDCSSKSTLSLSPQKKYGERSTNNVVNTAGIEK